ncbi:Metalloprotease [Crassisporium funariophilum]|nr:Metalloprotease [Crassisporium funariophilum]
MFAPSALFLLLATSLVGASIITPGSFSDKVAGASTPGEQCRAPFTKRDDKELKAMFEKVRVRRQADPINVVFDTYVNVVAANMTLAGGWVPDSQIEAQIKMLNDGYQGTGVSFKFINTTRILSSLWHNSLTLPEGAIEEKMLTNFGSNFRKGGIKELNINLVGFTDTPETYGFGLPPSYYVEYPLYDGIYIRYSSLPGGTSLVRQGSTVTHEAGHWLSLWHTFQNGCDGDGDSVDDTPAQETSTTGCPVGRDTCPGGGVDPIRNFMDYSSEECRTSFTPGQIARMQEAILAYRS